MRISLTLILFTFLHFSISGQTTFPKNGSKDDRDHYTAFINANIVAEAGVLIEKGTLLIKKDKIVALGKEVTIPENSVVYDLNGEYIYPSFIDIYTDYGMEKVDKKRQGRSGPQIESKKKGAYHWNEAVKAEEEADKTFKANPQQAKAWKDLGFGTVLTHRHDGVIRGTSALVSLGDGKENQLILKDRAALQLAFSKGSSKQDYPSSLMGMIALIRQTYYDAQWYQQYADKDEYNISLKAFNAAQNLPQIIWTDSELSALRADRIGDEFGIQYIIKSNGSEYKRLDAIKASGAPLIVPLNFPAPYEVEDPHTASQVSLKQMKHWELAPRNASYLAAAEIPFAFTTADLKKKSTFTAQLKKAVASGLSPQDALRALTETPAQLIGAEAQVGKLEEGMLANFIILSDSLFADKSTLHENWIQGKKYTVKDRTDIDIRGTYNLNVDKSMQYSLTVKGSPEKPMGTIVDKNNQQKANVSIKREGKRINLVFAPDTANPNMLVRLSGTIAAKNAVWSGNGQIADKWVEWGAILKSTKEPKLSKIDTTKKKLETEEPKITYPNMAYGFDSLPKSETIIFRNATIWTNEKEGILREADVLIHDGKIQQIGINLNLEFMAPDLVGKVTEIDIKGKHLTSGIIDEHSHIAISRGVNESGQAVSAEVSIGDVVNSDDINMYRQLAGGVTAAQLLHGSANPVGGQSALIKFRWGQTPDSMKIKDADGFIKFALGENVKQSNWGDLHTKRFPQTRMGVEQVFYDAFLRAQAYREEWAVYNAKKGKEKKKAIPPRRDLELEAVAEILDTNRFITCHSYIQSEINMLMHVADSMGFTVNTFTHILEGYKVADKLAKHGAAASTFSDWWAYKFEVNDAIPYNGAILHEQGVVTGFNSDDAEMGRRLNQEAAKAVEYGSVSESEAWKFVTLNPAKMLHLDDRMGSIKIGKDADIVIWSDNPLSIYAKAEMTFIDGVRYYDRQRDVQIREEIEKERARLIAKMILAKKKGEKTQRAGGKKKRLYHCDTLGDE